MNEHNHREFVEGCYRCDLSRDEVEPHTTTEHAEYFAMRREREAEGWHYPESKDAAREEWDRMMRAHDAEVVEQAAREAQREFVEEQQGIGFARTRTDWLLEYAARIRRGEGE